MAGGVALFIDWENLKCSLADPSPEKLIAFVRAKYGVISLAHAYAEWDDARHQRDQDAERLYYAGITPVRATSKRTLTGARRANCIDLKLCVDLIEASYERPDISVFVIVSGDSDFVHVVSSLRRRGKRVCAVGACVTTAASVKECVDEMHLYEVDIEHRVATSAKNASSALVNPALKKGVAATNSPAPHAATQAPQQPETASSGKDPKPIFEIMQRFVEADRATGKTPTLQVLGAHIRERVPGFDLKNYGRAKLTLLVQDAAALGYLSFHQEAGTGYLLRSGESFAATKGPKKAT